MGWITHYAEQQAWVVGLVVIASFMMVSIALAAWRSHRISSVSQSSFDELKKRAYDAELALLTGKENARVQMVRNKGLQSPMLQGLDLARGLGEAEEEREAHRQAKLDRIRKGEE
ncbi:hypothetical protein J2W40_000920 [Sphingobium xenophagum]|uniref:Uncharacterized protein n=2 Tax=Sphingobium xenophagum TaxID=121428 RepID=A0ABU1WYT3_SPHXE|nr:hypothetical protein [Sphingobium xenophagum]